MTNIQIIWAVVALAALIAVFVVAFALVRHSKDRSAMLRQRFGDEYERARQRHGRKAERVLTERLRRVEQLHIRELSDGERERFASAWTGIQAQFVDDPRAAVGRANDLIREVMRARGYPAEDGFEHRVADLSVDHPDVVQHYRAADALARSKEPIATEDLRQAVVHYRVIFQDLLEPTAPTTTAFAPGPEPRPA